MKIFVDMDGVCCDWMLPALMLINDVDTAVSKYAYWKLNQKFEEIKTNEFWDKLALKGEKWWYGLEEYNHYKPMMELFRRHGEVHYLTATPYGAVGVNALSGKSSWILKREGDKFRNMVFTHNKHLCAGVGTVLIDDTEIQCENFVKAGGSAILFPQPWNGHNYMDSYGIISFLTMALNVAHNDKRLITASNIKF